MPPVNIGTGELTGPWSVVRESLEFFPCVDPAFPILAGGVDAELVHLRSVDAAEADIGRARINRIRSQPNKPRWSAQGNGNSFGIRASESPVGWLPSRMADVTPGERKASLRFWRTT